MPKPQIFRSVDIESIELQLSNRATPESTVEELYRFGAILFSEIQQRGSEVDRKLTTILSLSVAMLGFVLANKHQMAAAGDWGTVVFFAVSVSALVCVSVSAFALKSKIWQAPSEHDWFKDELLTDASMLKRYHVVSLLSTHQTNGKYVVAKAACLAHVEVLLSASALAILIVLIFS